jgi:PAS domain S-box-containing protein
VFTALNGSDGIELARSRDPDAILLEITDQRTDGFEACRALKADERLRDIPVLFVTALDTDRRVRVEALESGADAFLSRPLNAEELVAQVRVMARLKAANRAQRADEASRGSERGLRRFYESGLVGVCYWTMDGRITDANDKFLGMIGYTRDDLEAGCIGWADMTPPEFRHADEMSVAELRATGTNQAPFEKEYIRKDGTRIRILVAGAMLDEARSRGIAFILHHRAQAGRVRAARERRALSRHLRDGGHRRGTGGRAHRTIASREQANVPDHRPFRRRVARHACVRRHAPG